MERRAHMIGLKKVCVCMSVDCQTRVPDFFLLLLLIGGKHFICMNFVLVRTTCYLSRHIICHISI